MTQVSNLYVVEEYPLQLHHQAHVIASVVLRKRFCRPQPTLQQ